MRDLRLTSASEWQNVLLVLLGFIVFFHVFFLDALKKDELWWKKTDYCWLLAAVLGVLSASKEWRKFEAQQRLELAEYVILDDLGQLEGELNHAIMRSCGAARYSANNALATAASDRYDCQLLAAAGVSFQRRVREYRANTSRYEPLYSMALPGLTEDRISRFQLVGLSVLRRDIERTRKLTEASLDNAGEITQLALAPYFLAIALALRITKVTADVRAAKAKTPRGP